MYETMLNSWRMTDLGYRDIKRARKLLSRAQMTGNLASKIIKEMEGRRVQPHK